MSAFLQIIILSRDRAEYLHEAIASVLTQNEPELDYEIIISDNSETDDVSDLINKYYLDSVKIKYIRRDPPISARNHYELVITELNSQFTVIFHDDDVLHPDYLKIISPFILNNPSASISCNAKIFKKVIADGSKKMHEFTSIKRFNNKKYFLEQYLLGNGGVAPFPGYIYNTEFLQKISFDLLISGKHFDVAFLSALLDYGPIIWLPETLMYYRVHDQSDSSNEVISARLRLLRYMFSEGVRRTSKPVFLYRYLFWLLWIKQQGSLFSNISKLRYRTALKFILFRLINVLFSSYFWMICIKKLRSMF